MYSYLGLRHLIKPGPRFIHLAPGVQVATGFSHSMFSGPTLESFTVVGGGELVLWARTAPVFRADAHPDRCGGTAHQGVEPKHDTCGVLRENLAHFRT